MIGRCHRNHLHVTDMNELEIRLDVEKPAADTDHRAALANQLGDGAQTRTLLKAWSAGGVPLADATMLDITMDLFNTEDCTRGFLNTAKAFDRDIEPPDMIFNGR